MKCPEWTLPFHVTLDPVFVSGDVIGCFIVLGSLVHCASLILCSKVVSPGGVHPACISGGSGSSGFLWGPAGVLRVSSGDTKDGTSLGPFAKPFPLCSLLRAAAPPKPPGAARKRGFSRAGRGKGWGEAVPGPPGAGGGLSGDSRRAPLQIRTASHLGAQDSGCRGCAITWVAETGPHLSGPGTPPASSASSGLAPAGRPALCPPEGLLGAAPRLRCPAMRAPAPLR